MIYYLVKAGQPKHETIDLFVNKIAPEVKDFVRPIAYEQLFRKKKIPLGTYFFNDLERLSHQELEAAAEIWRRLEESSSNIRLFNNPVKVMRRYALLRYLYEHELNNFNVYRLDEFRRPSRYPVFIRTENNHAGSETELINTLEELELEINKLTTLGKSPGSRIITEFCAEKDEFGLYRTYSAYNIGGVIMPRHLLFNEHWVAKRFTVINPTTIEKSRIYMRENPHAGQLINIFTAANIDYGRMDYSLVDGKIQTYEINTNPVIANTITERDYKIGAKLDFIPKFIQRLKEVDTLSSKSISIDIKRGSYGGTDYRIGFKKKANRAINKNKIAKRVRNRLVRPVLRRLKPNRDTSS